MLIVNERAEHPIYEWLEFINIHMSEVYEEFVNPEDSFREGLFYAQITPNLLIYLCKFHEWGPLCLIFSEKRASAVLLLMNDKVGSDMEVRVMLCAV